MRPMGILGVAVICGVGIPGSMVDPGVAAKRPNIVVIFTDDQVEVKAVQSWDQMKAGRAEPGEMHLVGSGDRFSRQGQGASRAGHPSRGGEG